MKYLVDNDVFFAAIYAGHSNHRAARKWLDSKKSEGWGIAVETYLAALRLLMNPQIMGSHALPAKTALDVVEAEIHGPHLGRIVYARQKPDRSLLEKASGHRQIMDTWLVQIAREAGAKLATCDTGNLTNWPDDTFPVR